MWKGGQVKKDDEAACGEERWGRNSQEHGVRATDRSVSESEKGTEPTMVFLAQAPVIRGLPRVA